MINPKSTAGVVTNTLFYLNHRIPERVMKFYFKSVFNVKYCNKCIGKFCKNVIIFLTHKHNMDVHIILFLTH